MASSVTRSIRVNSERPRASDEEIWRNFLRNLPSYETLSQLLQANEKYKEPTLKKSLSYMNTIIREYERNATDEVKIVKLSMIWGNRIKWYATREAGVILNSILFHTYLPKFNNPKICVLMEYSEMFVPNTRSSKADQLISFNSWMQETMEAWLSKTERMVEDKKKNYKIIRQVLSITLATYFNLSSSPQYLGHTFILCRQDTGKIKNKSQSHKTRIYLIDNLRSERYEWKVHEHIHECCDEIMQTNKTRNYKFKGVLKSAFYTNPSEGQCISCSIRASLFLSAMFNPWKYIIEPIDMDIDRRFLLLLYLQLTRMRRFLLTDSRIWGDTLRGVYFFVTKDDTTLENPQKNGIWLSKYTRIRPYDDYDDMVFLHFNPNISQPDIFRVIAPRSGGNCMTSGLFVSNRIQN